MLNMDCVLLVLTLMLIAPDRAKLDDPLLSTV
jgi:hypothetical protein